MYKGLTAILLFGVTVLFSGCFLTDKVAEKATEKVTEAVLDKETDADVDITDDGITLTDEETGDTVSLGESVELPKDFPNDVPIIEGATIITSSSSTSRGEHSATLTAKNFNTAEEFYREQIVKEGWTLDDESTLSIGSKITTFTASKKNRTLTVGLYGLEDNEVSIIITVQQEEDTEDADSNSSDE